MCLVFIFLKFKCNIRGEWEITEGPEECPSEPLPGPQPPSSGPSEPLPGPQPPSSGPSEPLPGPQPPSSGKSRVSNSFSAVGHIYIPEFYTGRTPLKKKFKQARLYISVPQTFLSASTGNQLMKFRGTLAT